MLYLTGTLVRMCRTHKMAQNDNAPLSVFLYSSLDILKKNTLGFFYNLLSCADAKGESNEITAVALYMGGRA